jgi:hypothetical protein
VYSLAQGDTMEKWRLEPFQMIAGGPYWVRRALPPVAAAATRV